jgi:uncharacterized protein (TIGR02328 family)
MRLWHQNLIPFLPRQQLLGQHRECCALRGLGWLKKHATINYIFDYPKYFLFLYHSLVMQEMNNRTYKVDELWKNPEYCGKQLKFQSIEVISHCNNPIYLEHDSGYLSECIKNLKNKGIVINLFDIILKE